MVKRQSSFELLRILSAAGIVWFHAKIAGSEIGYTGLAVFLILTPYFELGTNFARQTPWLQHAKRLLIPFLFWSAVYAAANLAKGKPVLNLEHGHVFGVLAGPSIHLWYLPFIAATLAFTWILKANLGRQKIAISGLILLLPLLEAFHFFRSSAALLVPPVGQWFYALTPVLLGIILGASRDGPAILRILAAVTLAASVAAWGEIAIFQFLVAIAAVELASQVNWTDNRVNVLSGYMMGVYLVHPLALTVFRPLDHFSQSGFVVCAFLASTLAVSAASRLSPASAELLLGTPRRRTLSAVVDDSNDSETV